ncbi:MAG: hypothetical protein WC760_12780 [Bacteroidia bacterium]
MRTAIILIILFSRVCATAQAPILFETPINVTIKGYSRNYLAAAIYKKKEPWQQTSKVEFWFNSRGLIIQSRFWGKQHNSNLKLLNKITQYEYDSNELRISSQEWENSYLDSIKLSNKTLYTYDNYKRLIKKQIFSPNENNPSSTVEHIYTGVKGEGLFTTISGGTKYIYVYDSLNRLKSRKQFYGSNLDKLNWIETYFYLDDTTICITNVFYGDSILQYSKQNITIYNLNKKEIAIIEDYLPPKESFPDKTEFEYDKQGLILSIKRYLRLSFKSEYILTSFIKYSYRRPKYIGQKSIEKINQSLINLDSGE